jgi:hypothetical protein
MNACARAHGKKTASACSGGSKGGVAQKGVLYVTRGWFSESGVGKIRYGYGLVIISCE